MTITTDTADTAARACEHCEHDHHAVQDYTYDGTTWTLCAQCNDDGSCEDTCDCGTPYGMYDRYGDGTVVPVMCPTCDADGWGNLPGDVDYDGHRDGDSGWSRI